MKHESSIRLFPWGQAAAKELYLHKRSQTDYGSPEIPNSRAPRAKVYR